MTSGSMSSEHAKNGIILLKVSGSLSIIASSFMLRDLRRRYRRDKRLPLTAAILCELAVADLVSSFMCVMGTWMVPKESGAYWAAGNTASCTAQGFFIHAFFGTSCMANASLAVSYCLIVRSGWSDHIKNLQRTFILLGFPPIFCFAFALIPSFFNAYNFNGLDLCQMASHPPDCISLPEVECTRGKQAPIFYLGATAVLFVANMTIVSAMAMLIQSVSIQEKKMNHYSVGESRSSRDITAKVAWQGVWYIAAFSLAFSPYYVRVIVEAVTGKIPIPLLYITNLTFPSQGIWNAFVYFRPRYKTDRERNPRDSRISSIGRVLRLTRIQLITRKKGEANNSKEREENNNSNLEIQATPPNNS